MNKSKFIKELKLRLRGLSKEDLDDAINYYEEYFLDSGVDDEEDVTQMVGDPKDVARKILEETLQKQDKKTKEEGGVKNSMKSVWLVVLGICAAPIAFPIIIVLLAVLFAITVTVFSIFIAAMACAVSFVITGIAMVPAIAFSSGAQTLIILGISLIGIGLGILLCRFFVFVFMLIARGIVGIFSKIFKRRDK